MTELRKSFYALLPEYRDVGDGTFYKLPGQFPLPVDPFSLSDTRFMAHQGIEKVTGSLTRLRNLFDLFDFPLADHQSLKRTVDGEIVMLWEPYSVNVETTLFDRAAETKQALRIMCARQGVHVEFHAAGPYSQQDGNPATECIVFRREIEGSAYGWLERTGRASDMPPRGGWLHPRSTNGVCAGSWEVRSRVRA